MISYRHHIVSLVAVFLALAVGIVLGGGPLTELGRAEPPAADGPGAQRATRQARAQRGVRRRLRGRRRRHAVRGRLERPGRVAC